MFDTLLARTDPPLVGIEMDVYWVTKAGSDPIWYLRHHPHRFPMLHLKDATAAPERRMVDVGAGTIDWTTSSPSPATRARATPSWSTTSPPIRSPQRARVHSYLSRLSY